MISARLTRVALAAVAIAVCGAAPAAVAHDARVTAAQVLPTPPAPVPQKVVFETPKLTKPAAIVTSDEVFAIGTVTVDAKRTVKQVIVELRDAKGTKVRSKFEAPLQCIENCGKVALGSRTYRFGPVDVTGLDETVNVLRAIATPSDGSTALTADTMVEFRSARPNLFLKALEINQGQRIVFDTNPAPNSGRSLHTATELAPLIGGRPTVVRAYPGSNENPVANVTGLLFGTRDGAPLPGSPLRPAAPVTAIAGESLDVQAADAGRTLNFVLPPEWTAVAAEANTRLTLDLNSPSLRADEVIRECSTCRNSGDKIDIRTPAWLDGPAELRLIPHRTSDTPPTLTPERMFAAVARMFPIDPADIVIQDINSSAFVPNVGCNAITTLMQRPGGSGLGLHYAVTRNLNNPSGCAGVAAFGYPYGAGLAGGIEGEFGDTVVAQELGHELGLDHAGCSHGEQSVLGCSLFPHPHGGIGNPGFDVPNMLAIPPGNPVFTSPDQPHMHDFMSYGTPSQPALPDTWVSQDTWTKLRAAIMNPQLNPGALAPHPFPPPPPPPPPPSSAEPPPPTFPPLDPGKLLVIAMIGPEPGGAFAYVLDSGSVDFEVPPDPHEPAGEYELRAFDANGNLVDQRFFSLAIDTSHVDSRLAWAILDNPAGIARLDLLHQGTVIGTRTSSPDSPLVQWTDPPAPTGSAKADAAGAKPPSSGRRTVSWTASDANGDALTYNVEFSRDGGRTYHPVQLGLTDLSSTVDLSALPSTPNGRFRVVANDGFHATVDQANRPIAIGNHPPKPFISAPGGGSVSAAGAAVVLTGAATDVDEGRFPGRGLTWSSNRDGDLGSGMNLGVPRLSIGRHRITLTADDGDGARARRSVSIRVVAGADDGRAPRATRVTRRGARTAVVRFSEDVVGVGTRSLRVFDARGRALAATVTYDARTRTARVRARRGKVARVATAGTSISDLGGRRLPRLARRF